MNVEPWHLICRIFIHVKMQRYVVKSFKTSTTKWSALDQIAGNIIAILLHVIIQYKASPFSFTILHIHKTLCDCS